MSNAKANKKQSRSPVKGKALKPAPHLKSIAEEAHFGDTHDTTEYELEDMNQPITIGGSLKARVKRRRAERLAVFLGLDRKQMRATLKIAQQKGITSEVLIRNWVQEGLRRESARA